MELRNVSSEWYEAVMIRHYIEAEEEFIKNIETLLNTIGEENIIAVQFLNGKEDEINGCIITYKE